MPRARNFLYKASLLWMVTLLFIYTADFLLPMLISYTSLTWVVWEWIRSIANILEYGIPIAFLLLIIGRKGTGNTSQTDAPAKAYRTSIIWRWIAGLAGIAMVVPVLYVSLTCLTLGNFGGCFDYILLFAPIYMIAIPVFMVSVLALFIQEIRHWRA